jgi:branched-chain amino acid transport system substrate-binding protein
MRIPSLPPWLRIALALAIFLGLLYPFFSRDTVAKPAGHARGSSQWPPQKPIRIAVPWNSEEPVGLVQGVLLALDEINAGGSPLAGKINIKWIHEPEDLVSDGAIARQIAADHDVVAVIGHESSSSAVQSSVTYEREGILHLSPKATLSRLTKHRFQYTFRLVPNDDVVAAALVEYARIRGWKHIGILYSRIEESEAFAQEFSLRAIQEGLVPAYFRSYLPDPDYTANDFRVMLASASDKPADAILLADRLPWAGKMLTDMQAMGMPQPVLAGDNLDSDSTWAVAGKAAERLNIASFVDPESAEPAFAAFRARFQKRFGSPPDYGAAQGYAAFRLYVNAVERSRSSAPIVVATTIRTNTWDGIFGKVSFSKEGEVDGRKILIKRIQDGRFVPVREVKP